MKKVLPALFVLLSANFCIAQTLPNLDEIKLEQKSDYDSTANNAALKAANFLFSTPLDKNNMNRLLAQRYVIRWMTGTPDYSFGIDATGTKFTKKNDDLIMLYMAAMTKYTLENSAQKPDDNSVKLNAVKIVVEYSKNAGNGVKQSSELKKAIAANDKGELKEYLKL